MTMMVWYGMVWYGMVWYGMVWYGMVWYGVVWYGMVWYAILFYVNVFKSLLYYGFIQIRLRFIPNDYWLYPVVTTVYYL